MVAMLDVLPPVVSAQPTPRPVTAATTRPMKMKRVLLRRFTCVACPIAHMTGQRFSFANRVTGRSGRREHFDGPRGGGFPEATVVCAHGA